MEKVRRDIRHGITESIICHLDKNFAILFGALGTEPLCLKFNGLRDSVQSNLLFNIQDSINPRAFDDVMDI